MSDEDDVHSYVIEFDNTRGVYFLNCLGCEAWFEMDQTDEAAAHTEKSSSR